MRPFREKFSSIFLCAASLTIGNVACAQQYDDPALQAIAEEERKKTGNIDIYGSVVSESGEPLLDVSVDYEVRKYGDVVAQVPPTAHSMSVNGSFRLRKKEISSISMAISKNGYYGVTWEYNFSADKLRKYPDGEEIVEIEITLKNKPAPAPLEEFEGFLRTGKGGPTSTLTISNPEGPRGPLTSETIKTWEAQKASLPKLFLVGETEGEGGFAVVEFIPRGQNHLVTGLAHGRVEHSSQTTGDGFVVFDPGEVPYRHKLVFRDMNMAPVKGYFPSIELRSSAGPEIVYFYFRIGGHHGKGMVTGRPTVVGEGHDQVAIASAVVFVNPTGSRNLAFIHN